MSNGYSHRYLDADDHKYDASCDCGRCNAERERRDRANRCENGVPLSKTAGCYCSYHERMRRELREELREEHRRIDKLYEEEGLGLGKPLGTFFLWVMGGLVCCIICATVFGAIFGPVGIFIGIAVGVGVLILMDEFQLTP